ncbi:ATP-binding protein, partial [bacterium]|nr:ATP-binding protein [bacterium]
SVLALLAEFVERGLRLIEIQQNYLHLIPELSNMLKDRPEKFLIYCDDLSFAKDSTDYKHLKTIMEGSVLNPAGNLLLIATANRKDLVFRGELDERMPEQRQLIDEKRAIDDRFGLKLFYEVPVFKQLQEIIFHYANQTGLKYNKEDLVTEFHQFAQRNNHDRPAGRTVQQFISEWAQNRS